MLVQVGFAVCEEARKRVRQRADSERGGGEGGLGGAVLPEGECWNIEHAVLI